MEAFTVGKSAEMEATPPAIFVDVCSKIVIAFDS